MKKPDIAPVEVDMVPLIDIISLLLMFLIIVGDTSANTTSVKMKLPTASEAKTEKEWGNLPTKNRIVIQMTKREGDAAYSAIINNKKYNTDDSAGKTLKEHLEQIIDEASKKSGAVKRADGTWDIPVKMRVPEETPMFEVEKVLKTIADLQLVDVQYAALKPDKR